MRRSIVRLAILSYPRRWRRRYGAELEQLTTALLARPQSPSTWLRVLLDLIANGLGERVRRTESARTRVALTSASAVLAGMFTLASGLAADAVSPRYVQVSPSVHLGPGVTIFHSGETGIVPKMPGRVVVAVPKGPDPQVSVSGRAVIVVNPKSGLIVSVMRAPPTRRR